MPITHTNEDGSTVEVFTKEELESKSSELATEKAKTIAEEQASQIISAKEKEFNDRLQAKEKELSEALAQGGGNADQIERLRKEREDAKNLAESFKSDADKRLAAIENLVHGSYKDELVKKYNPTGNKDIADKILLEFDNYMPDKTSREDIARRMEVAARIANPGVSIETNPFAGAASGVNYVAPKKQAVSEQGKAQGKNYGIKDEDYQKYGNK